MTDTFIDMSNLQNRKRVIVIAAKYALSLEVIGLNSRSSPLKRMQQPDMGFKSKRKKPMLAEITAWLDNQSQADRREADDDRDELAAEYLTYGEGALSP